MSEADVPIEGGQGAAGSGSSNSAERSLAARGAEKIMRDQLAGLPALKREDDPRWQAVYDTKPDDGVAPQRIPDDPESDRAYLNWRATQRNNQREYHQKADDALRAADPDTFDRYQRYGIYTTPEGNLAPGRDPELSSLFLDHTGKSIEPTDSEIEEFKQKYPEKAALYETQIENARQRNVARIETGGNPTPSATNATTEAQKTINLPAAIDYRIGQLPPDLREAARYVAELRVRSGNGSEEEIIQSLTQDGIRDAIGSLSPDDMRELHNRHTNGEGNGTPPPPTETAGGSGNN
ncbi:MAG TPA: hypothetical protein VG917_05960, partial [Patescibacteria group bacterium]|nr:hypothetical protein [Patescibacteria group bacterium]